MNSNGRKITITEAQAIRYRRDAARRDGSKGRVFNAIVVVDGYGFDGQTIRGIGECQFRFEETGENAARSWEDLGVLLPFLPGTALAADDATDALRSVETTLQELEHNLQTRGNGAVRKPSLTRGLQFGLETALLDLVAQAFDAPLSQILVPSHSHENRPRPIRLHRVRGIGHSKIEAQIRDLSMSTEGPIWIDFGSRFGRDTAVAWVQRLVDMVDEGVASGFVEYRALRDGARRSQPKISVAIEDAVAGGAPIVTTACDVSRVASLDRDPLLGTELSKVVVRPANLGGLIPALRLIENLADSGATEIYLAMQEGGSPIGAEAVTQLASATPLVKGVLVPGDGATWELGNTPEVDRSLSWLLVEDAVRYEGSQDLISEDDQDFNLFEELPYLQQLGPNGTKGHLMEREALSLGMDTVRFSKGAFTASDRTHEPMVFKWSRSPISSAAALSICTHKEATRMRLGAAGVPVPRGRTFANGDFETAKEFANLIGFPVVVKPAMGVRGIGVVAGIKNQEELDLAFKQLRKSKLGAQDFIVEKHISGKDYRIVVVGDEVVAAILREPAAVTGDGHHSVAELMLKKNAQRRLNPHLWGRPIVFDAAAEYQLHRLGLTADSVLPEGQRVLLSNSSSLSQGGESFDVLDELHPSIVDASVAAVKAIPGLEFCGVDFLIEDHTLPIGEQEAGICELNAHAAIGNCEYPLYGKPRQVAQKFMRRCVEVLDLDVPSAPAKELSVEITVRGRVSNVGYLSWLKQTANEYGIVGWARRVGPRKVEAVLFGETKAVSALVAAAVLGSPRSRPTSVSTIHVEKPEAESFTVRKMTRNRPAEIVRTARRQLRRAARKTRRILDGNWI